MYGNELSSRLKTFENYNFQKICWRRTYWKWM
jgi:hypothetical protein